jgi:large repetitive protein
MKGYRRGSRNRVRAAAVLLGAFAALSSFTASAQPAPRITTTSLPDAVAGAPYRASLAVMGGKKPFLFTVISGTLPAGLILDPIAGTISGTPTTAGTSSFTVLLTDANLASDTQALTVTVNASVSITTAGLPPGTVGVPYSQALAATGGSGGYTWSVTSGSLPTGLTLSASGLISGVPSSSGTSSFTVQVRNQTGATASQNLTITVSSPVLTITTTSLTAGVVGGSYAQTLTATGGSGSYTWSVSAGSLPPGLTLSSGGVISGSPAADGNYAFTIRAQDSTGAAATSNLSLNIGSGVSITTAPVLPSTSAGVQYSQTLAATGGTPPYTWSITSGSLPAGLSFSGNGMISGTPTSSGTFQFTVTARDAAGLTAQKALTLSVGQGLSFTTPASLPNGTTGSAYTFTLGATGGQAPYSWAVSQGSLPPGLALNGATGTIGGTPTAQGTYNFTLRVSDASGQSVTRIHTIVVGLPSSGPSVSISGIPAHVSPVQQFPISVSLSAGFPADMTGQLSVSFAPGGPNPMDDPAVQFSTGGRTASFTIPANTTHAVFSSSSFAVQVGSVTGTLTFSISSLTAGGNPYTPPGGSTLAAQIDPFTPSIRSVTVVRVTNGFNVQVVGVTDMRDLSQASVRLESGGSSPQSGVVTIPLANVSKAWFQSQTSGAYGGQFTLTLPFTFSGADPQLSAIGVTLSNGAGDSQESSGSY